MNFGTKLKYPLTVNRLLKKPNDQIKKQEPILQFKFTWKQKVGDPFGDEWEEEQITIADWDSPADGCIKSWRVHEGMVIQNDMSFVEIEESCPHSVQFAGLCGICGKDMTEVSWASAGDDTGHAKINMIHNQTALTISEDEASKAEGELQKRLLQNRKLSLVVDLDQTIIHACIEPTIGEWQRNPQSPNFDAVKDVRSFQLNDDGPRGVASGCWYYIKMRPGLKGFLDRISEFYELHVYTMGTRAYAANIAKIVDPDKRLFGDRIISRDENGSITTKSLSRLFPVSTKMVVIIDDRADVWPQNRPNLIKVVPYDFFLGIGDINSSFLPKREDVKIALPSQEATVVQKDCIEANDVNESSQKDPTLDVGASSDQSKSLCKASALEELVRMSGGDDQAIRFEQAIEQEKLLEKQLNERPLLHMQEELDKEELEDEGVVTAEPENGTNHEHPHHRHNLLKDDDEELQYLENHLIRVHKAFYENYDGVLANTRGVKNIQLDDKNVTSKNSTYLKMVPDIADVMPQLKAKTLAGCIIVTSGLVPLQTDIMKTELGIQATTFGAKITSKVSKSSTHLVTSITRNRTSKVRQATKYPSIKIVNQDWLFNSISKWEKEDEEPYLIYVQKDEHHCNGEFQNMTLLTTNQSDDSDSSVTGDEFEYQNTHPLQGPGLNDTSLIPPVDRYSPIEDLREFDWEKVDDELAEFMGEEDSENDSETSESTPLNFKDQNSVKRKLGAVVEDDDSEYESILSKKQKLASERISGLSTVTTPYNDSEDNLPKPLEADGLKYENGQSFPLVSEDGDADLEALLMAEFEKEDGGTIDNK